MAKSGEKQGKVVKKAENGGRVGKSGEKWSEKW